MNVRNVISVLLFCIITLLVLSRVSIQSTLALEGTTEILRHARILGEGSYPHDDRVVPNQMVGISMISVLIAGLSALMGETVALLLLQFASILVLVAGLDGLLSVLAATNRERWAVMGMVVLSPTLIYWGIAGPPIALALQVLGAVLLAKKKWVLGLGLLLLASLDGILVTLVGCGLVALLYKHGKVRLKYMVCAAIVQLVAGLSALALFVFFGGVQVSRGADLGSWVLELGGQGGISIVVMGLALLGALVIYKRKYALEALLVLAVVMASLFIKEAQLYAGLALAIIAGLFLAWLLSHKRELRQLRILSYAAIVLGIAGVVAVSCSQILLGQPDREHLAALQEMEKLLPEDAVVFAPQRWGYPIELISKRIVVLNARSPEERVQNLTRSILDEVYLPKLEAQLKKEGITHIYLPQEIIIDRQDDDPSGGLVYLLQNGETFKNVYQDSGAGVWEYLQSGESWN